MCMVPWIFLWWLIPQDECIFNTLPYYITDLFITTYRYNCEGMTPPDVLSTWSRGCSFNAAPLPSQAQWPYSYTVPLSTNSPTSFNLLQSMVSTFVFPVPGQSYQLGDQTATLISFLVFFPKGWGPVLGCIHVMILDMVDVPIGSFKLLSSLSH